jgi:hypothetical protein
VRSGYDDLLFVVENFRIHLLVRNRLEDTRNHQVHFALLESAVCHARLSGQQVRNLLPVAR